MPRIRVGPRFLRRSNGVWRHPGRRSPRRRRHHSRYFLTRLRRLQALVRLPPRASSSLGRRERADRDEYRPDPGVRTPLCECSGSRGAPPRIGRRARVPCSGPGRSRRRGRTRGAHCQMTPRPGASRRDARARPTGGGRATRFHPYPGSDQSRHGAAASRAGRRATGTIEGARNLTHADVVHVRFIAFRCLRVSIQRGERRRDPDVRRGAPE